MSLLDNFWIGFGAGLVTAATLLLWYLMRGSASPRGLDMQPRDGSYQNLAAKLRTSPNVDAAIAERHQPSRLSGCDGLGPEQ
jgi:hypothetical protein